MKLIKLKLRSESFWGIPPIYLNPDNDTSPALMVDLLTQTQIDIINRSCKAGHIFIKTIDGENLEEIKHECIVDSSYNISVDDIEMPEAQMPEIISVTESYNEEEVNDNGQKEIEAQQERERMLSDADILLKRHGNVIKNTIGSLNKNEYNYEFAKICLSEETLSKNRFGVIESIKKWINNYQL